MMLKATQKSIIDIDEAEEEIPLHGSINEDEAKAYRESLDKIFQDMAKNIENNIANALELAIIDLRTVIMKHITSAEDMDTGTILKTIRDPTCLALGEQTEAIIEKLEEILPDLEIASGGDILKAIDDVEALMEEQKHDIGEIFDNLEIVLRAVMQTHGGLSRSLSSKQLLLLLKASVRPLIQINAITGFFRLT